MEPHYTRFSRRHFLRSATAAGLLTGIESIVPAYARAGRKRALGGNTVDLTIVEEVIQIGGRSTTATLINGTLPGPLLRFREGDDVTIRVTNRLKETTSIHWHGIIVPFRMDGVPGVSFSGIRPGETFSYRLPLRQNGTYWYHSHSGLQEQTGQSGPLVIDPAGPSPYPCDREYVVMLSDWTFMNPYTLLAKLKKQGNYSNYQSRTVGDFFRDVSDVGFKAALSDRVAWGKMRMDPTDMLDITAHHFTYLMNGLPSASNWTGIFRPGERVRLRFINASAATFFDVRIPGLPMTVIQADGQYVQPVTVDEFRISIAETFDVIIQPNESRAYTVFAETIDRSGFARGTLAPRVGMSAAIPEHRKRPERTMADMGMADHGGMSGMNGGSHRSMQGMPDDSKKPPAAMDHSNMPGMSSASPTPIDHSNMPGMASTPTPSASPMDHGSMPGMEGASAMAPASPSPAVMDHANMAGMEGMNSAPGSSPAPMDHTKMSGMSSIPGNGGMQAGAMHGPDKHGPGNQAVAMMPQNRLAERGTGLEDAPWRVLVYADLRGLKPGFDRRAPQREIELHATGNMDRYMWSFDGKKYSEVDGPIRFYLGERVRLTLVNDTMMEHPLHLHGMWMQLVNGHGAHNPLKHTIGLKPGEKLSVDITADAPGVWAFHCHVLYHMEMGMFRVVMVAPKELGA